MSGEDIKLRSQKWKSEQYDCQKAGREKYETLSGLPVGPSCKNVKAYGPGRC